MPWKVENHLSLSWYSLQADGAEPRHYNRLLQVGSCTPKENTFESKGQMRDGDMSVGFPQARQVTPSKDPLHHLIADWLS